MSNGKVGLISNLSPVKTACHGPIVRGTKKGLQVSEQTKTLRKQRKYGSMVHFFG
jgi:hypothetical protein